MSVIALLALAGLIHDLFGGLAFSRSAQSWSIWVGGLILAGLIYAVGEIGFDWITAADKTTDPLAIRVLRLVLGLSFVAALILAVVFLARAFSR